jgi:hypothetical protein
MNLTSIAKFAIASVYGYGLQRRSILSPVCSALKSEGIYVAPELLDGDLVNRLIAACDEIYDKNSAVVSVESNGTDARIYGVERLSTDAAFKELQSKFLKDAKAFYGSDRISQFCMSGDIVYRAEGIGSGSGWHRDSPYRHQFKVIVYLSDASLEQGPFEYIPKSHTAGSAVNSSRALGKSISNDRYTDDEIDALWRQNLIDKPRTVVGKAGTILFADTRGLHRGRPLESGRRRAITIYVYHKSVPGNFQNVLVEE